MLTGQAIKDNIACGRIVIDPPQQKTGPNSCDLSLSGTLGIYGTADDVYCLLNPDVTLYEGAEWVEFADSTYRRVLDMKKENPFITFEIPPDGLILKPGQLYLGCTQEYTETRGFVPMIETRSSVARLGVTAHISAGFGDSNFFGTWVLEIVAFEPVRIYAGVRFCSISYSRLDGQESAYDGKYQSQRGPVPSRLYKDFLDEPSK